MKYSNGHEFTQVRIDGAYIDFVRQNNVLVVTFECAGKPLVRPDKGRYGWGGKYLMSLGYSCLFVKPARVDWYRNDALYDFLDFLKSSGFFSQFSRVVFAGGSMGGYAALAFSSIVPGSTVIALNPQASLSPKVVPWEQRFPVGLRQNWDGRYSDAAKEANHGGRIWVVYDPFCTPDRLHAERIQSPFVEYCRIPFVGHQIPRWMKDMGMLKEFMERAIDGTLTKERFDHMARSRRTIDRYYKLLHKKLVGKQKIRSASLVRAKAEEAGFSVA